MIVYDLRPHYDPTRTPVHDIDHHSSGAGAKSPERSVYCRRKAHYSLPIDSNHLTLTMLTMGSSLQGERQLEQRTREESSNSYDKHLLSRIGGPNDAYSFPKRPSVSATPPATSSVQQTAQLAHAEIERRSAHLKPLSMPERIQQTSLDSPASSRWLPSGAVSPGSVGFWSEHGPSESSRLPSALQTRHSSLTFDDSVSQRGSYDQSMFVHEELVEDGPMSNLRLYDRSPGVAEDLQLGIGAGIKRRASSPPRDPMRDERSSVSSTSSQGDVLQRRSIHQLPNRGSPISRFHANHISISSVSSVGPRQNSLGSSLGVASVPSSATSYGSGRISPIGLSPASIADHRAGYAKALNPTSAAGSGHHRSLSESTQRSATESTHNALSRSVTESLPTTRNSGIALVNGVFVCECCPKKPKKFDTEKELRYMLPLYCLLHARANPAIDFTREKSSTPVLTAPIASRTRMKLSGIKILSTYGSTHGAVRP